MSGSRQYRILGTLGKGGFGKVYKAELLGEGGFSKTVALKVMRKDVERADDIAQRLRDEARILGLIQHRAIVKVDALALLEGQWAIVMEYIRGVDLKTLVRATRTPPSVALEIVEEIAAALHQAWVQEGPTGQPLNLLHRDIKPSNIQLTDNGTAKLLDFGTARGDFQNREAETKSMAFGTVEYMSPERLEFIDTPAGDVYGLGVVLFELLTSKKLGRGSANPKRHVQMVERAKETLSAASVPQDITELLISMIEDEPEKRPSARAVERTCRRIRGGLDHPLWLTDWAKGTVPPLMRPLTQDADDPLMGRVLSEGQSSEPQAGGIEQGANALSGWVENYHNLGGPVAGLGLEEAQTVYPDDPDDYDDDFGPVPLTEPPSLPPTAPNQLAGLVAPVHDLAATRSGQPDDLDDLAPTTIDEPDTEDEADQGLTPLGNDALSDWDAIAPTTIAPDPGRAGFSLDEFSSTEIAEPDDERIVAALSEPTPGAVIPPLFSGQAPEGIEGVTGSTTAPSAIVQPDPAPRKKRPPPPLMNVVSVVPGRSTPNLAAPKVATPASPMSSLAPPDPAPVEDGVSPPVRAEDNPPEDPTLARQKPRRSTKNTLAAAVGVFALLLAAVLLVVMVLPPLLGPSPSVAGPAVAPPPGPEVVVEPTVAPPASTGTVAIRGDASGVRFIQKGQVAQPGPLAVGRWTVEADFGKGFVAAGFVTVVADQSITLDCRKSAGRCTPQ